MSRLYELIRGAVPASVCPDCGVLVWNTGKHDTWHERVDMRQQLCDVLSKLADRIRYEDPLTGDTLGFYVDQAMMRLLAPDDDGELS